MYIMWIMSQPIGDTMASTNYQCSEENFLTAGALAAALSFLCGQSLPYSQTLMSNGQKG